MKCRLRNSPQPFSDSHILISPPNSTHCSPSTLQILISRLFQPIPFLTSYAHIFQLLTGRNLLKNGQQTHAHLIVRGLNPDSFLAAKMVAFYASCRCLEAAVSVFERVEIGSGLLYNAMIRAFAKSGVCDKAIGLYVKMRDLYLGADHFTLPFVLKSCADLRWGLVGKSVHGQSLRIGLIDDMYVSACLIGMYVKFGETGDARKVFDEIPVRDVASWNSMITGYMNDGEVRKGMDLFQRMPLRDIVSCTAMISGFAQNGLNYEALRLFYEICSEGNVMKPHWITIVSVLSSCAHLAALDNGRWIHRYADSLGFGSHPPVQRALMNMYAKSGSLSEACHCFNSIKKRDLIVWNTLITAYAFHGHGTKCVDIFEDMIKTGIQPDHITFVGLLSGCSHSGFIKLGLKYFNLMKSTFSVEPNHEHYSCIISLLSRAGLLTEALNLVNDMPFNPGPSIWTALLSSCVTQRNIEIADIASKKLSFTDPECTGSYMLISNLLAESGMPEKASSLKSVLRRKGMKRSFGYSWIELNHQNTLFFTGDDSHYQKNEIYALLNEFVEKLKCVGYDPETAYMRIVISEEEKMYNVGIHSERLAIAYGILNTGRGEKIRVTKNLRICEDCHTFIKMISMLSGREIFVRDVNRFHHFCNGGCSCGDFW